MKEQQEEQRVREKVESLFDGSLRDLIKYYYMNGNGAGGNLHIALDDGNLSFRSLEFCRDRAMSEGDAMGVLICDLLYGYTEEELDDMYEKGEISGIIYYP